MLPAGGSNVCSHTFSTTRSAPCSAASAAAHVSAVRLPGDPSTPTTMVFHPLTVASSSSADAGTLRATVALFVPDAIAHFYVCKPIHADMRPDGGRHSVQGRVWP